MKRYVATFHKTGTALMGSTLRTARKAGAITPWIIHETDEPEHWDVAFERHANRLFATIETDPDKARYVIVVRDPRDLIISAAYYHCKSDELWLHKPLDRFDGLTYQQKILTLETMEDKFLFEMDNSSGGQIRHMLATPVDSPSVMLTSLERLVTDYEMEEFTRVFDFLGFEGETLQHLLKAAHHNSLFSGKVKQSVHARSGKPAQWKTEFTPKVTARFNELFPGAPDRLGYESGSAHTDSHPEDRSDAVQ